MNPLDAKLNRLFRAAARAPGAPPPVELPFPAEARVLAAWRQSRSDGSSLWLGSWLRVGLAVAVAVAALAVTWSTLRQPPRDEYAVANAALYVAVSP
jgi:hypothetical protein